MNVCVTKFSHIYIKKMLNMWVEKRRAVPPMQSSSTAEAQATRRVSHNVTFPYTRL